MKTNLVTSIRRLLAGTLFLAAATAFCGNATLEYPFVGTYKREAAQGMAIHKDTAFLFNNTGICRMYNLKTGEFITSFELDTLAPENHSNCADFGVEYPAGNHSYPAIYVSECYGKRRCFVESINASGAKLIQTLAVKTGGKDDRPFDWYVDREKKFLYSIAIVADDKGMREYRLSKYRLPALSAGDVNFTKADVIEQFTIKFSQLSQGGTIRGDYLYMPVGHPKPSDPKKDRKDRGLLVVNLKTKQIEKTLELNQLAVEPEDIAFHGDKLLMYCGQSGGLWHITGF
ncbi:hypothetical protein M2447_001284 [Ereboglobus sp. PH5-10]|uniref:hypothetical protein n=1 Tax=Ereboglobus sp. PH5-10 TaxID=2940629 RepID=UPI002406547B|nr:hypothetical protein [Ereboglobus sp. PH5-10]MDF9827195.1 hypothetical protein [Ereboglobus sp. PH5-10]